MIQPLLLGIRAFVTGGLLLTQTPLLREADLDTGPEVEAP